MTVEAKAELRQVAGPDLDDVVERLSDEEAAELLTLFQEARRTQGQAVSSAIDDALNHVPRPLRGTARKILLG